jgi:hypothetical protein
MNKRKISNECKRKELKSEGNIADGKTVLPISMYVLHIISDTNGKIETAICEIERKSYENTKTDVSETRRKNRNLYRLSQHAVSLLKFGFVVLKLRFVSMLESTKE